MEAVFLTAIIDAWENHKVAVLDVPGVFMQVDMDELVHVWFRGEVVDKLWKLTMTYTQATLQWKKVRR